MRAFYRFWNPIDELTCEHDAHRCAFKTTKTNHKWLIFWNLLLLLHKSLLFSFRLRMRVANYRFSTREKIVMCCALAQHNLREILPRSSQKSFLRAFFQKSEKSFLCNFSPINSNSTLRKEAEKNEKMHNVSSRMLGRPRSGRARLLRRKQRIYHCICRPSYVGRALHKRNARLGRDILFGL